MRVEMSHRQEFGVIDRRAFVTASCIGVVAVFRPEIRARGRLNGEQSARPSTLGNVEVSYITQIRAKAETSNDPSVYANAQIPPRLLFGAQGQQQAA
jgi:hypothetical protein